MRHDLTPRLVLQLSTTVIEPETLTTKNALMCTSYTGIEEGHRDWSAMAFSKKRWGTTVTLQVGESAGSLQRAALQTP
jgi:hypothetical protein